MADPRPPIESEGSIRSPSGPEPQAASPPASPPRFIADPPLGKVARWLRALGYDTLYLRRLEPSFLARALAEGRLLLTRSSRLAAQRAVRGRCLLLREELPAAQVREVLRRLGLGPSERALRICMECNAPLQVVAKAEVAGMVPEFVFHHQPRFFRCPHCRRVYWPGSHAEDMEQRMAALSPPSAPLAPA
ncbi:MAG: Mut7-C RNAse domain-containing protein [Nitrospinota bacterium]